MKMAAPFALSSLRRAPAASRWLRYTALGAAIATAISGCAGDSGHGDVFISDASPDKGKGDDDGNDAGSGGSGGGRADVATPDARSDASSQTDAAQDSPSIDTRNDTSIATDVASDNRTDTPNLVDISVVDSASDVDRVDVSIDGATNDARTSDTGTPDISVDSTVPDATVTQDVTPDIGKPDRNTTSCDPFGSQVCADCEAPNCPRDPTGCGTPSGCSVQPACDDYSTPAEQALCKSVLSCIRLTSCLSLGTVNCYCGLGVDITACKASAASATGDCKDEITAAFAPLTTSKEIVDALLNVKYPGGGAMSYGECDFTYCGSPGNGGGNECIPYCKSTGDAGADATKNDSTSNGTDGTND